MKNITHSLSIIMPTYNRPKFALRNIDFWRNSNVILYVLDGSSIPFESTVISTFHSNIIYIHANIPLYERIKLVLDLIKTKYTILLGDNQFFFYSALNKCISELENDSKLVACIGRALQFDCYKNELIGQTIYENIQDILDDDSFKRIESLMSNYVPTSSYSVVKSEFWISAMKIASLKEYPAFALNELVFEMSIAYYGKIKILPTLMWLRSLETEKIRGVDISDTSENDLVTWWLNHSSGKQKNDLLTNICHHFSNISDYKKFENGLELYVNKRLLDNQIIKSNIYKLLIKKIIPKKLISYYRKIKYLSINRNIKRQLLSLENSGVSIDWSEFYLIKSNILNFNSKS